MRRELQDQWGSQPLITAFLDQLHQLAYRADDSGSSLLISHLPANQDLLSFCCVANDALSGFEWNEKKLRMIGKILLYLLWCPEAHSDSVASSSSTYGLARAISQASSRSCQKTQPSDRGHGLTCPSRCGCGPYATEDSLRRHLRLAHPELNRCLNKRLAAKAQTAKLKAHDK